MVKINKNKNKEKTTKNHLKNRKIGVISISSRGTGYVALGDEKNMGEDPEIPFRYLNTALHGDTVEIAFHPKNAHSNKRQTAEVVRVISRTKTKFTGILEKEKNLFFLRPDDTKMYEDILIPKEFLAGAKDGDKAFAEITTFKDPRKNPEGKILKVLGRPGHHDTEMRAIALEKGFDSDFPKKVEEEAEKLKRSGITKEDYIGRRDFRKVLTFTIDPSDAKDFDDAISFQEIKNGSETLYEIGIHIADVSHYVKIGSNLDKEARERGTSVYLVDRTIPMLPEILSNDLCSLLPNQDRLTMSAVFVCDKNGAVKNRWFGRTVIHSQKRLTYEEAEKAILEKKYPLHKQLSMLNEIAKKLTKERMAHGAVSLEQDEVKFVLNMYGVPVNVIKKERGYSNKLIEELMLLANKEVAKLISGDEKSKKVSIYRVHDFPSKEKMEDLAFFLRHLGHNIDMVDGVIPTKEINKLLESIKGKDEADTIQRAIVKSMAKAIYSTKNIGHYGLAFPYYTHFTSPIRRYPDIIVHRLLMDHLSKKKIKKDYLSIYENMARAASMQEKRATDAERSSVKYKQVEYMSKKKGEIFEGIISSIAEWGIYVEEKETKCEGLIKIRDIGDDFYIFNEKKMELQGEKKKKKYRLGDRVKIKVKDVDLERKTIDYLLV